MAVDFTPSLAAGLGSAPPAKGDMKAWLQALATAINSDLDPRATPIYASRAAAVTAAPTLPPSLSHIAVREGTALVIRSRSASSDDPLFDTGARWGVVQRQDVAGEATARAAADQAEQTARINATRDTGLLPLANVAGTPNAITADIAPALVGVTLSALSTVLLVPAADNSGPATLNVGGTGSWPLQRGDGTPVQAGDIRTGVARQWRRVGSAWRLVGLAHSEMPPSITALRMVGNKLFADMSDGISLQVELPSGGSPSNPGVPTIASFYGTKGGDVDIDWRFDEPNTSGATVASVRNDGGAGAQYALASGGSAPRAEDGYVDFVTQYNQLEIANPLDLNGRHMIFAVWLRVPSASGEDRFPRLLSHATQTQRVTLNLRDDLVATLWGDGATTGEVSCLVPRQQWALLEVRHAGGRASYYINGALVSSVANTPVAALMMNRIGKAGITSHWLNGRIGRCVHIRTTSGNHIDLEPAIATVRQEIADQFGITMAGAVVPPAQWPAPAGWSTDDAQWDNVTLFSDFRRALGLDQSEQCLSIDYVPEKIPSFDSNGAVFDGTSGYVTTYSAALGMGNVDATVEIFGVVPSGEVARAVTSGGAIQWGVRHSGSAWILTINNGGTPTEHVIPDPVPTDPVDLAIVRQGTALRFFRGGQLLYTGTAGAWAAGTYRLVIAGAAAPFSALRIAGVRVTRGVARYSTAYTSAFPGVTGAKVAGGGLRVAYGAMSNFNAPIVLPDGDKVLYGMVTRDALAIDHDLVTRRSRMKAIYRWPSRDAHNNPAFLKLPDGRVMQAASGHDGAGAMVMGLTDGTGDLMTIGATPFTISGVSKNTYVNIFQLEGEPGAPIYLLGRANWKIYLARTYDLGQTWQYHGSLFPSPAGERPYIKIAKTSPTRLDFFCTYSHPETVNPGLFHIYYEDGAFHDSFGNQIGLFTSPPISFDDVTRVFDGTVGPENSWQFTIDKIGNSLFGTASVSNFLGNGNPGNFGHYIRARFDLDAPGPWQIERIHDAGGTTGSAHGYPGVCLDLQNADRAFVSVKLPSLNYQLLEVLRSPTGQWDVVRQITNTPTGKNIRPHVMLIPQGKFLSWLDGDYVGNNDFRSSMRLMKL